MHRLVRPLTCAFTQTPSPARLVKAPPLDLSSKCKRTNLHKPSRPYSLPTKQAKKPKQNKPRKMDADAPRPRDIIEELLQRERPVPLHDKPDGWKLYELMGRPKTVVAPMVDQSELPFRMMTRKYGAELAYTPMIHARLFETNEKYRRENFTTCDEDRPLFVQFCAHDPQLLLAAARRVEDQCDAVDINFGCPQGIARKGNYGAFLMDDLPLVYDLVSTLHVGLKVPVVAKMRIFPDDEDTLAYARLFEAAGAQILAVHGRTRDQKGQFHGMANWDIIKRIRDILTIPVLANGNIDEFGDVERCLEATGTQGVLSAETLLKNPALFSGEHVRDVELADEYLDYVEKYPVHMRMIRAHLFKILGDNLKIHTHVRELLSKAKHDLADYREVVASMRTALDNASNGNGAEAPVAKSTVEVQPDADEDDCFFGCMLDGGDQATTSEEYHPFEEVEFYHKLDPSDVYGTAFMQSQPPRSYIVRKSQSSPDTAVSVTWKDNGGNIQQMKCMEEGGVWTAFRDSSGDGDDGVEASGGTASDTVAIAMAGFKGVP